MTWEVLGLSILQRMKKLVESLLGKYALERGPRMQLDKLFVKRLTMWLMDPLNHLSRARSRDGVIQTRSLEDSLFMAQSHDVHGRPTRFLRMLYQQKHGQLGLKGQRQDKVKECCWISRILLNFQSSTGLLKLLSYKHMLPFKKNEEWL